MFLRRQLIILMGVACIFSNAIGSDFISKVGIGFNLNGQKLLGDTRTGKFVLNSSPLLFRLNYKPNVFIDTEFGYSKLNVSVGNRLRETEMFNLGFKIGRRFYHDRKIQPLAYVGFGVFNFAIDGGPRYWDVYGAIGGGAEVFPVKNVGLNLTADFRYTSGDEFDGNTILQGRDAILNISFGVHYYFRSQDGFSHAKSSKPISNEKDQLVKELASVADDVQRQQSKNTTLALMAVQSELEKSLAEKKEEVQILRAKSNSLEERIRYLQSTQNESASQATNKSTSGDSIQISFRNGLAFFETGHYESAVEVFRTLISERADDAEISTWWYWLGESYYGAQEYELAVASFQNVLSRDPHQSKTEMSQLMLGVCSLKMGETNQAKIVFEKLLKENPKSDYVSLAKYYLSELQLDQEGG